MALKLTDNAIIIDQLRTELKAVHARCCQSVLNDSPQELAFISNSRSWSFFHAKLESLIELSNLSYAEAKELGTYLNGIIVAFIDSTISELKKVDTAESNPFKIAKLLSQCAQIALTDTCSARATDTFPNPEIRDMYHSVNRNNPVLCFADFDAIYPSKFYTRHTFRPKPYPHLEDPITTPSWQHIASVAMMGMVDNLAEIILSVHKPPMSLSRNDHQRRLLNAIHDEFKIYVAQTGADFTFIDEEMPQIRERPYVKFLNALSDLIKEHFRTSENLSQKDFGNIVLRAAEIGFALQDKLTPSIDLRHDEITRLELHTQLNRNLASDLAWQPGMTGNEFARIHEAEMRNALEGFPDARSIVSSANKILGFFTEAARAAEKQR